MTRYCPSQDVERYLVALPVRSCPNCDRDIDPDDYEALPELTRFMLEVFYPTCSEECFREYAATVQAENEAEANWWADYQAAVARGDILP